MKISQALDGFWLSKQLDFSPTTVRNYERVFSYFLSYVGGKREIETVTSDDIRRYLDYLHKRRKLGKRSVHSHWAVLSSFWTWAELEIKIPHIIRGRVPAPTFRSRTIVPFTQDEIKRLINAATTNKPWSSRGGRSIRSKRPTALRDKAIILTLLDTGVRATELCELSIKDYDAKRGRLHIRHGKGDKERFVTIGTRARKSIWQYLATRSDAKPTEPLFATRERTPMRRENLLKLVVVLGNQAGVTHVHPHRFRHTFAIQFLRNGGNVLILKELMGHEKLETLMVYVHLAEQDIDGSARHSPADNWRL